MKIEIKQNVSLANFSAYGTGGPALFLAEADDWKTMLGLREFADMQDLPFTIVGDSSNVVFDDEGYEGLVILNEMRRVHYQGETIVVQGGVNILQLILAAAEQNLGGITNLASSQGTVHDALNQEGPVLHDWLGDFLISATILSEKTNAPTQVTPDYFRYRRRKGKKDIILDVTLHLEPMAKAVIQSEIKEMLARRVLYTPSDLPGAKFFRNPEGFPSATWLLENSNCGGLQVGGAMIHKKNPSYIVNTGLATSDDIEKLSLKVRQIVKQKYKINLEPIAEFLA